MSWIHDKWNGHLYSYFEKKKWLPQSELNLPYICLFNFKSFLKILIRLTFYKRILLFQSYFVGIRKQYTEYQSNALNEHIICVCVSYAFSQTRVSSQWQKEREREREREIEKEVRSAF